MNRLQVCTLLFVLSSLSPLSAQHKTLEELTKESPLIVAAHVDSADSFIAADGEMYTNVRLEVASILKDSDQNEPTQLNFIVKGGQIGDRVVFFTDSPRFEAGEDILLFGSTSAPEEKVSLQNARGRAVMERVRQYRQDDGEEINEREKSRMNKFLERLQRPSNPEIAEAEALDLNATNACSAYIGPKWATPNATYALGGNLPPSWAAPIQAAAQAWTQGGSRFAFTLDSKSPHTISLADLGAGNTLASTRVEWQGSNMLRFSMTFNNRYVWNTTPASGQFDIQAITAHELGHALGLNHPGAAECAEETMWASAAAAETKKRSLEAGDKNGIVSLYGAAASTTPPPPPPPPTTTIPAPATSYFGVAASTLSANKPLVLVFRGSALDPARVEGLVTGGVCGTTGCVIKPIGASATDLVFSNVYPAGAFTLRLRSGPTGTLGTNNTFTVVP